MVFKYLIELSQSETEHIYPSLHTSAHYFNMSVGVKKEKIKEEFVKLSNLGLKPYALHIEAMGLCGFVKYKKVLLGGNGTRIRGE